jgi:integrase/recombinase XerD
MSLSDVDRKRSLIVVRLKGARDEHRVPVPDDFWPMYERYLKEERRTTEDSEALWVALRKGRGKPLTYATFESSLRYIGGKAGVLVHTHLFRHTLAQGVLDLTGNLKVAQEILGHAHISTAADIYTRVDQVSLVTALAAVKSSFNAALTPAVPAPIEERRYVFAYDADTIAELEDTVNNQMLARRPHP